MEIYCSIIIPAYKEKNLSRLIDMLINQRFPKNTNLKKIVVVASGYKKLPTLRKNKVVVIKERKRMGKTHAINLGLNKTKDSNIIVVISGDVLPKENAIEELLKPFSDSKVGMTGGRPIPINPSNDFVGFTINTVWKLLHMVSLNKTKTGEIIAFRNIIEEIPKDSAVDEASIEAEINEKGYKIVYCPAAIVRIKGPETLSDLIKQRKRIFIGHLHLKRTKGYEVSTMSIRRVTSSLFTLIKKEPLNLIYLILAVLLEAYIRLHAAFDFYILGKNPVIWEISKTSKL